MNIMRVPLVIAMIILIGVHAILPGSDTHANVAAELAVTEKTWHENADNTALLNTQSKALKIFLGVGCFWKIQKDIADVEIDAMKRAKADVTALAGYAGSTEVGPNGLVCYLGGPDGSVYDALGYAEAVQVELTEDNAAEQLKALLAKYFGEFEMTQAGMQRGDPQDTGSAYRSVLGLPGGLESSLIEQVKTALPDTLRLERGSENGDADKLGTIWVYDTKTFPFHRAERYHQFWDGPAGVKAEVSQKGSIGQTGCPEKVGTPYD